MASKQGHYEVVRNLEVDLHTQLTRCEKNPGHKEFIPANRFSKEHLPDSARKDDIFELIRLLINLTVQIYVGKLSPDRPDNFPKGPSIVGSGHVCGINTDGEVQVATAQHVVFNDDEAKSAVCCLFYDSDEERDKIVKLHGENMGSLDIKFDWCKMTCRIQDTELRDRLKNWCRKFDDLCNRVWNDDIEYPLAVIVSHPHGCSKQVTLGKWTPIPEMPRIWTRYYYTAHTCEGSSGAPVFFPGKSQIISQLVPHSEYYEGQNRSVVWFE